MESIGALPNRIRAHSCTRNQTAVHNCYNKSGLVCLGFLLLICCITKAADPKEFESLGTTHDFDLEEFLDLDNLEIEDSKTLK
jgi:hypothetical protein